MTEAALQLLSEKGTYEVIEFLAAQQDPQVAIKTVKEIVGHLYWKQKDIHRTVVMAQAGIQFGLMAAVSANQEGSERVAAILSAAKGLAYDLGSFTWPGWDEPGIAINATYRAFGREAARLNLRLANDLNKGDLPVARACWLVGAHCLAEGAFQEAVGHFSVSETYAQSAGAEGEALLGRGYGCLACALQTPQEAGNDGPLSLILTQLAQIPDGADLAAQLQTAWTVFARSCAE